jgi:hypothetical protein
MSGQTPKPGAALFSRSGLLLFSDTHVGGLRKRTIPCAQFLYDYPTHWQQLNIISAPRPAWAERKVPSCVPSTRFYALMCL